MPEYSSKLKFVWQYLSTTLNKFRAPVLGYKTYKALLTQSGTDAPVATVLDNSLGLSVTYEYDGNGQYFALLSKELFNSPTTTPSNQNVEVTITPSSSQLSGAVVGLSAYPVFYFVVGINVTVSEVPTDEILGNSFTTILEIKVYDK